MGIFPRDCMRRGADYNKGNKKGGRKREHARNAGGILVPPVRNSYGSYIFRGDVRMRVIHSIAPVYDANSKILILGSFPSVKSRESKFFYGHPQNRFWRVIAAVCGCKTPETITEKKEMLLLNNIALWDVIESCDIEGSSDSSIRNVRVNDFSRIFAAADIQQIFANGGTAYNLYKKHVGDNITRLPSTSPANAAWNQERLIDAWRVILNR